MTLSHYIETRPIKNCIVHIVSMGGEYLIDKNSRSPVGCTHMQGFQKIKDRWVYNKHLPIKQNQISLFKTKNIMLPTQENLITTYKLFPEHRFFLTCLFGDFLDVPTKLSIEQEDKIKELEAQLKKCNDK